MSTRELALRACIAVAAIAIGCVTLEVSLRLWAISHKNAVSMLAEDRPLPLVLNNDLALGDLIQIDANPAIVYSLRPGARGRFLRRSVVINSLGFRDRERSVAKGDHTLRLLGLGDSHMFGWGVSTEETFLSRLEDILNKDTAPGRTYEVWNLAVPGYNTVQEVALFDKWSRSLKPDGIVINFVNNDMDLPNFSLEQPNYWNWRESFLGDLLRRRLLLLRGGDLLPSGLIGAAADQKTKRYTVEAQVRAGRFASLAGWENMKAAFAKLAAECREKSIRLFLLINMDDYSPRLRHQTSDIRPRAVRDLASWCRTLGFVVVDPQDRVMEYLRAHNSESSAVWLSESDSHTNAVRHELVAQELAQALSIAFE